MAELYVNVNGTWKTASNYYVNVNGTWKEGSELHAKVSSAWKESSAGYSGTSGIVSTNIVLDLNASNSSSYAGSGTTWSDISGNNNDLTLTNGPTFTSSDGGAIVFDGTDDSALSALNQSFFQFGTGDYSYGVWVKFDTVEQYEAVLSSGRGTDTGDNDYEGSWQVDWDSTIKNKIATSGTNLTLGSSLNPTTGTWYYLFVVNDRSEDELKLYVNGSLNTTHSDSGYGSLSVGTFSNTTSTYNVFRVGQNRNLNKLTDGSVAQVHVYKGKALTASEVLQNYLASGGNYFGNIITSNLVLHLDASNNMSYIGSGTTWTDISGQGYSASLYNGVSFSSSDGGSLFFDGTNDYAQITSASGLGNFSGNFTIEFWLKRSSHNAYGVVLEHYSSGSGQRWCTQQSTNNNNMYLRVDSAFTIETSGATINDTNWHHHVVSRVGSTITYYIDTVSRGTATNSSDVGSSGDTLRIGSFSGGGSYATTGSIPQIRIYDGTGFTAAQVLQNYNTTKGNFLGAISTTNLVFYVDAGKSMSYSGSGTTWTDLSSSSNDGTLTNGPTFNSANGGSIVFDATDDYVQFSSDTFNPNADFTISAWVNLDTATGTNNYTIISDVNNTGSFQLRYKNGSGVQIIDNNTIHVGTFTSSTLSITTWYNVTVTRSSNTYTLYLNGSSTSSFTSSNTYNGGARSIGANIYTSEKWDGKIAQVFAYSSALSASEVLANYNATKATFGY